MKLISKMVLTASRNDLPLVVKAFGTFIVRFIGLRDRRGLRRVVSPSVS